MIHHDRDTAVLAANGAAARTRLGRLERGADLLLGGALLGWAATSSSRASRVAGTLLGGPLVAFGVLGARPRLLRGINVVESVIVDRSPAECLAVWMKYEGFPRFMDDVKQVTRTSESVSHWIVRAGRDVEWDAEVVKIEEGKLIEWKTLEGSDLQHAGSVRFEPADGGCKVTVTVRYYPPGGLVVHALAKVLGEGPGPRIAKGLQRFKKAVEKGAVLTPT